MSGSSCRDNLLLVTDYKTNRKTLLNIGQMDFCYETRTRDVPFDTGIHPAYDLPLTCMVFGERFIYVSGTIRHVMRGFI